MQQLLQLLVRGRACNDRPAYVLKLQFAITCVARKLGISSCTCLYAGKYVVLRLLVYHARTGSLSLSSTLGKT